MYDYSGLQATATRLITKFGRQVTLLRESQVAADPSKPWNGPGDAVDPAELPIYAAFVPPNTVRQFGLTALGLGTDMERLLQMSEQIAISATADNDVRDYQDLRDTDNTVWGIIGIQQLKPGTTGILSFIGVKR